VNQQERARAFKALHQTNRPLLLPNIWDAASARIVELEGASAIATTSAGVSWAQGHGDGQRLSRGEMIAAVRSIVRAVRLPVTADIEGGYGTGSVQDVTDTVRAVLEAGVVGINLEDSPGCDDAPLLTAEAQAERIRAARAAALETDIDLFINARTDTYLLGVGAPEQRLAQTLRRAEVYLEAGADGIFVPGASDAETIAALVRGIPAPLNVMLVPGLPVVADLERLGVARVSLGAAVVKVALEAARRAAREFLQRGAYSFSENSLPSSLANTMFNRDD
jgi:2-methylisocitrate lyase-like PEP mutase family enzyme